MKKGLNQWSVPKDASVSGMIELAAATGFDGIELLYRNDKELGPHMSLDGSKDIARKAAAAGLEIIGFASGTFFNGNSLVHGTAEQKSKARAAVEHVFETARALGAGSILCVPGVVDKQNRYDHVLERVRAYLPALAPYAEKYGVDICIENVWNRFLLSPLEMAALIDEVGSARIGSYFDIGNIPPFGFPEQWIRILGPRIKRVHVKDNRPSVAGLAGMVGLGEGDVDWAEVGAALSEIGYDGYLTAEINPNRFFFRDGVAAISSYIDGIIDLVGKE